MLTGDMMVWLYTTKEEKTFGRKFPSYDGNAGSPTRAHQNTRLSSVVTLYQSVKNTFLVYSWNREANNRNIASGYNLFVKENINAYDTDYNIGDFAPVKIYRGGLTDALSFPATGLPRKEFFRSTGNHPVDS